MFSVPRFDPNQSHNPKGAKNKAVAHGDSSKRTKEDAVLSKKAKRKRAAIDLSDEDVDNKKQSELSNAKDDLQNSSTETKKKNVDSSSVPSSESDSSSVASSDDDDEKHSKSTLKVIAPSQPAANDSKSKRKHEGFEDEAIDDFDADFDIIENENTSEKTSTPSHMNVGDVAAARALRLSKLPIAEVASDKHWSLPPFLL